MVTVAARPAAAAATGRLFRAALLLLALLPGAAAAQSSYPTDGSTPLGLKPGAPAGSYAVSGFDNVNLYNGSLNFRLPLVSVGGRGAAAHTVMLPVEKKWMVEKYTVQMDDYSETHYYPDGDWWQVGGPGYGPGVMHVRYGGSMSQTCLSDGMQRYRTTLTRLTFTAADGTEYELRDQLTGGAKHTLTACANSGKNRGKTFVTADGTSATFISDTDVVDYYLAGDGGDEGVASGYLMLRDGTRYRIDGGYVSWMRDRNGNRLTFSYASGLVTAITDSLNRQVTIQYNVQDAWPYSLCDRITYKGFGGAPRVVRVSKTSLGNVLRAGYSLQSLSYLFPNLEGSPYEYFNPTVVSDVWLPDGDGVQRRYQLRYNSHGELARVVLPTGGAVEYDHGPGWAGGTDSGGTIQSGADYQIYRRVLERREYADGATLTNRTTYGRGEGCGTYCTSVVVDQSDAAGTLLGRQKHYFYGNGAAESLFQSNPVAYPAWDEGREYQTEAFAANGATVLRRVAHTWQGNGTMGGLTVNARVVETVTTLEPSGANLVARQTFAHDQYNNQTDVYDYGYGAGAPGALLRRTHTDYLTTNPVNGASYAANTDIHIRSLPTQVSVYDAAGAEQGRTTFEYDNYAADAYHAALVARPSISGLDAAYTTSYVTRGNATASSRWLLPAGTPVTAYAQYDVAGHVVKAIDPRGYQTTLDFADRFGSPNGEARSNAQPAELGAQASYAFASSSTNALGHTAYVQFDYYLGRPVDAEDANGVVSSGHYNDVLDRPTQLVSAVGTGAQSQTAFAYDDAARTVTTTGDLNSYGDNLLKSESLYDQMGRTYESRQYESATAYSATRRSYDALGRAYRLSNPFRPWQGQSPVWTTTQFDALGRTVSVTTPDGAQVTTAYSGNQVTVTDQAGKQRRSVTDALGRTAQVVEDPAGLGYVTDYAYDALGNLRRVSQGQQLRHFMYDSLGRLVRAKLPEQAANGGLAVADPVTGNGQWSAGYWYDNGGNLTQRTDARGVTTTYQYDALSRPTFTDYSDTAVNPDVRRYYDNPNAGTYGRGRFWYDYAGGDYSAGQTVEHVAVDSYDAVGRPAVRRQHFKTAGAWSGAYQTSIQYNRAGAVVSQTYPSGRTVSYGYYAAGRLASFTGLLGDGAARTYSAGISYDEAGRVRQEQFGTATPLYHKRHYNARGQLYDVRLSSYSQETDPWNWNRGAIVNYYSQQGGWVHGGSGTDNNGNVKLSQHWVPDGAGGYNWMNQYYEYDALNRLSWVKEQQNGATYTGEQHYSYDRFGNREINAAATWGTNIPEPQFAVDQATNRLGVPTGYGGSMQYDNAGNLTYDTYTGAGGRAYDAEGRMISGVGPSVLSGTFDNQYWYDADGRRVRRKVESGEVWQVYGIGGELLAEYGANAAPSQPQKEYGYRSGELLVVAESPAQPATWQNAVGVTVSGNSLTKPGGVPAWDAGASSVQTINSGDGYVEFTAAETNTYRMAGLSNGDSNQSYEDIDFAIYPTEGGGLYVYEAGAYKANLGGYAAGDKLKVAVEGGSVKYYRNGALLYTSAVAPTYPLRVDTSLCTPGATLQNVVLSAGGQGAQVRWLIPDHLGTPRMTADQTGSLTGIRRHDYLPFGEEVGAGVGGRTTQQGYAADNVRQRFTGHERDAETGLDYAQARYYANTQGRFTSVDPLLASATLTDPQSFNRYAYVSNNPVAFSDPSGMSKGPANFFRNSPEIGHAREVAAGEVSAAEADYEERLEATTEAVRQADAINAGLRAGTISNEQAVEMAANNPMLAAVSPNTTQGPLIRFESVELLDSWDNPERRVAPEVLRKVVPDDYGAPRASMNLDTKVGPEPAKGHEVVLRIKINAVNGPVLDGAKVYTQPAKGQWEVVRQQLDYRSDGGSVTLLVGLRLRDAKSETNWIKVRASGTYTKHEWERGRLFVRAPIVRELTIRLRGTFTSAEEKP